MDVMEKRNTFSPSIYFITRYSEMEEPGAWIIHMLHTHRTYEVASKNWPEVFVSQQIPTFAHQHTKNTKEKSDFFN